MHSFTLPPSSARLDSLTEGQKVEFELQRGRNGKSSAEEIKIID